MQPLYPGPMELRQSLHHARRRFFEDYMCRQTFLVQTCRPTAVSESTSVAKLAWAGAFTQFDARFGPLQRYGSAPNRVVRTFEKSVLFENRISHYPKTFGWRGIGGKNLPKTLFRENRRFSM